MINKTTITTREAATELLKTKGWKLIHSDTFIRPASSFEIWTKRGYHLQLRLAWPKNGDCNGATTMDIEIERVVSFVNDARYAESERKATKTP